MRRDKIPVSARVGMHPGDAFPTPETYFGGPGHSIADQLYTAPLRSVKVQTLDEIVICNCTITTEFINELPAAPYSVQELAMRHHVKMCRPQLPLILPLGLLCQRSQARLAGPVDLRARPRLSDRSCSCQTLISSTARDRSRKSYEFTRK